MEGVEAKDITEVQEVTEAIIVDAAELATGPALNEVMLAVNLAVAVVVEEKAVKEAPEANEVEGAVVDLIEADKEVMVVVVVDRGLKAVVHEAAADTQTITVQVMKNALMVTAVTMTVSAPRRVRPRPTPHLPLPLPWPVLTATKARRTPFLIPLNLVAPQAIVTTHPRRPLRKSCKVTTTLVAAKNQQGLAVAAALVAPRMATVVIVNLATKLHLYPVLLPMLV